MPNGVVVGYEDCKLITVAAGSKALSVALTEINANLGIALYDMKNAAEKVKDFHHNDTAQQIKFALLYHLDISSCISDTQLQNIYLNMST